MSIRNWQSCLLLQFLSSTVWCDTRSKHNLLDIPLLSKSHHILSTTDIRLEILMILMTRSTMNCSKIEDDIILCRSKWQVLDRLADIILDERGLQLLTITQSWLVILYYRIRSTRLNDIEVIYLGVWITLLNQICKMGTNEAGTASDNIVHKTMFYRLLAALGKIKRACFALVCTIIHLYLSVINFCINVFQCLDAIINKEISLKVRTGVLLHFFTLLIILYQVIHLFNKDLFLQRQ